jgi:hypothetical protein
MKKTRSRESRDTVPLICYSLFGGGQGGGGGGRVEGGWGGGRVQLQGMIEREDITLTFPYLFGQVPDIRPSHLWPLYSFILGIYGED